MALGRVAVSVAWLPREIHTPVNGAERDAVRVAQRLFRLPTTGEMDWATRAALRGLQRISSLEVTGILNEETAVVIDSLRPWMPLEGEADELAHQGHG